MVLASYTMIVLAANTVGPMLAKSLVLNPYLVELFAGALLGGAASTGWAKIPVRLLVSIAVLLLAIWIGFDLRAPLARALILGGAAMALVASAEVLRCRGVNGVSLLSRLGDSSYSLYLIHYALLEAFSVFLLPRAPLQPYLPLVCTAWIIGMVCVSHAFHLFVERPIYDFVCAIRNLRESAATLKPL